MRFITLILCAAFTLGLTACSIEDMAAKVIPEHILANDQKVISKVMARDISVFDDFYAENDSRGRADFDASARDVLAAISKGEILRTDIVGANSSSSISSSEGKTRTIVSTYEVQTEQGFTLIELTYGLKPDETCCALSYINVKRPEFSQREMLERAASMAKTIGLIILASLLVLIGLIIFFVRRNKRKKAIL
ncbi:MAG: hypothetical protein V3U82_03480 [Robiginitomaculum sp.]